MVLKYDIGRMKQTFIIYRGEFRVVEQFVYNDRNEMYLIGPNYVPIEFLSKNDDRKDEILELIQS